jgi:predicted acylesterase/phospholipase RssA
MLEAVNEKLENGKPRFSSFMDPPARGSFADAVIADSLSMRTLASIDIPLVPGFVERSVDNAIIGSLMRVRGYRQLFSLIERGGLYAGAAFRLWLEEKLAAKELGGLTLGEFHARQGADLSLAVADTTDGELRILNHRTAPDCPVSWAVRMSMSIPFIWQEVVWRSEWGTYLGDSIADHTIVDGGVLSNFPLDLLIDTDAVVQDVMGAEIVGDRIQNLGFLIDETLDVPGAPPAEDADDDDEAEAGDAEESAAQKEARFKLLKRVGRLVDTMMSANNKRTIEGHEEQVCRVPAKGYGTTEFAMSEDRVRALVDAAAAATHAHLDARGV